MTTEPRLRWPLPIIDADALIKKIPRPERSGWISIVIMLCALHEAVTPSYALEQLCQLLPWGCPQSQQQAEEPKKYKMTPLVFGNGPGEAKDVCHLDVRFGSKLDAYISHLVDDAIVHSSIGTTPPEYATDKQWALVPATEGRPMSIEFGQYIIFRNAEAGVGPLFVRWHCTKSPMKVGELRTYSPGLFWFPRQGK